MEYNPECEILWVSGSFWYLLSNHIFPRNHHNENKMFDIFQRVIQEFFHFQTNIYIMNVDHQFWDQVIR